VNADVIAKELAKGEDMIKVGMIEPFEEGVARKLMKYVPFRA